MNLDRFFKRLTMTMVLAFGLLACATTKPMTQKPSLVSALAPAPASTRASTVSAAPTSDNLQGTTLVTSQATDVTNAASAISASNSALKTAPILPPMPPPKGPFALPTDPPWCIKRCSKLSASQPCCKL